MSTGARPPQTGSPDRVAPRAAELPIEGFTGSPAEIERQWFERVYLGRGDSMKQLTARAVVMGSLLGGVLSLTNLYVGLKAGWSFGVAITSCILSYAIWSFLLRVRLARTGMTILENNCMQSTASAAGYSTGCTLFSAFAALMMLNGQSLPVPLLMLWVLLGALLGVTLAVPMKRQMINVEQLRFPGGIAAAETLTALHSRASSGNAAARALGLAGILAATSTFLMDGLGLISARLAAFSPGAWITAFNQAVFGPAWIGRTVMFVWDPIFIAAGVLAGPKVGWSMLAGGTLCWAVFVPILQHQDVITGSGFRTAVQWTLWGGAACMVTSGILSFALQWRSAARAFRGLAAMFGRRGPGGPDPMEAIEVPQSWFLAGQAVALAGLAWLGHYTFQIPVWQSVVAVLITFALALVACRVTGETDTTPHGPMGKVTQLLFGALSPGNTTVNLMSANITAGAALSSADLLTDLKSGYLLGANPRQQFLAQFAGIFSGTLVTVLAFRLLVPDASVLGGDQFPAPAALTWKAVAEALSQGFGALEPVKLWSIAGGGLVGAILTLLPAMFPRHRKYLPSAAAVGLSWSFHWYYGLLFFLGGLTAHLLARKAPRWSAQFTFPVASGVIAGGSLMGVCLIFWENGLDILRRLFGG
jgi:uncharacterized oligopeptide transporter (OPT) family protein